MGRTRSFAPEEWYWYSATMITRADTRRPRCRTLVALLLLPLAMGVQAIGARHPGAVESVYSRAVFPRLVAVLSWLSSRPPFSVAEVGLLCAGTALIAALLATGRALLRGRGRRGRILGEACVWFLLAIGAGYALFLLAWGLNYQRLSFGRLAELRVVPTDRVELAGLSEGLIDAANALRDGLPEDEHGAMRLADGSRGALTRTTLGATALMTRYAWLPPSEFRPKPAWTSPLLSRLGIYGFYSPWTAEAHVNVDVPFSDIPFSAAHEVAHQLGFAREDEANYLGYLICRLHPDADFRYSGTFIASRYAQAALASVDRPAARTLQSRRSPAVIRDLAALAAWASRHEGPAMKAAHRVNDRYLRTQGQDGTRSYGRMVDLLLAERRAERESRRPSARFP